MTYVTKDYNDYGDLPVQATFAVRVTYYGYDYTEHPIYDVDVVLWCVVAGDLELTSAQAAKAFGNDTIKAWEEDVRVNHEVQEDEVGF